MSGFEDKFADLNLGHKDPTVLTIGEPTDKPLNQKVRKNRYPSSLYPVSQLQEKHTTPSRAPELSTARRAEHRNMLLKVATPGSKLTHRIASEYNSQSERSHKMVNYNRVSSLPSSENVLNHKSYQLSFMRQTSSSLQKQKTPETKEKYSVAQRLEASAREGSINSDGDPGRRRLHFQKHRNSPKNPISSYGWNRRVLSMSNTVNQNKVSKNSIAKTSSDTPINETINDPKPFISSHEVSEDNKTKAFQRLYSSSKRSASSSTCADNLENMEQTSHLPQKISSLGEMCRKIYDTDSSLFEVQPEEGFEEVETISPGQKLINTATNERGSIGIYEKGEILRKSDLYYIPDEALAEDENRYFNIRNYAGNFGFDDTNGNYIVIQNDHINYRYKIQKFLGNGSFGNVVRCSDHKFKKNNVCRIVAVKIITNDMNWSLQAVSEIKMLKFLNEQALKSYPSKDCTPILTYYNHFHFRGHMCIVSEELSLNLYSLLEITKFRGFTIDFIKVFAKKILEGLKFIHKHNIIHCDIKPENIMIKLPSIESPEALDELEPSQFLLKLIDFGSSCFENEMHFSYVQSRFYRAPEVIIGARYSEKIDIWSFGCVMSELYTGRPLLPGNNEIEQIAYILELFGAPSSTLIKSFKAKHTQVSKRQNAAYTIEDISSANSFEKLGSNILSLKSKGIQKTLLYKLFDAEGKINLQFLNLRLQTQIQAQNKTNNSKRRPTAKLNSKNLDVELRLNTSSEGKKLAADFSKFLGSIFLWDPNARASAEELLESNFLS